MASAAADPSCWQPRRKPKPLRSVWEPFEAPGRQRACGASGDQMEVDQLVSHDSACSGVNSAVCAYHKDAGLHGIMWIVWPTWKLAIGAISLAIQQTKHGWTYSSTFSGRLRVACIAAPYVPRTTAALNSCKLASHLTKFLRMWWAGHRDYTAHSPLHVARTLGRRVPNSQSRSIPRRHWSLFTWPGGSP